MSLRRVLHRVVAHAKVTALVSDFCLLHTYSPALHTQTPATLSTHLLRCVPFSSYLINIPTSFTPSKKYVCARRPLMRLYDNLNLVCRYKHNNAVAHRHYLILCTSAPVQATRDARVASVDRTPFDALLTRSPPHTSGIGEGSSLLGFVAISTDFERYTCSCSFPSSDAVAVAFPLTLRGEVVRSASGTNAFVAGARSSIWYYADGKILYQPAPPCPGSSLTRILNRGNLQVGCSSRARRISPYSLLTLGSCTRFTGVHQTALSPICRPSASSDGTSVSSASQSFAIGTKGSTSGEVIVRLSLLR